MEKQYYIIELHFDAQVKYLIWVLDEIERLVTYPTGGEKMHLLTFKEKESLLEFAIKNGLIIEEESPAKYDFDLIAAWIKNQTPNIDCKAFLNAWNLFTDIATSLGIEFKGNKKEKVRNRIYDKLFFGNNIPGITPEGQKSNPKWSKKEVEMLAEIINEGLTILRKSI